MLPWSFDPAGDHPYDATVWGSLAEEIDASTAHTVLLSSELFAPVAADKATAPLLRERLHALSDDVTVVLLVRDQLSLLNGLYCQRVRALELTCDFNTYVADSPDSDVYALAESFASWYTDADIRFLSMTWDPCAGQDTLASLLDLAGIVVPLEALSPGEIESESIGPVSVEADRLLGSYLRGRFPEFRPGEPATRRLRRRTSVASRTNEWDHDVFWGWSPEQAADATARYEASNQEFAHQVWGEAWPLTSPVERRRQVAQLVELDPSVVNRVHRYLLDMEEAFARLRRREAAA